MRLMPTKGAMGKALLARESRPGLTLVELLVVVSIIAVLMSLLLPALGAGRSAALVDACGSSLRQITLAASVYAMDHAEQYVPAAVDIFASGGGLMRWHGVRSDTRAAFEAARGPLAPYLGGDACVRACPSFPRESFASGFEAGNGGYGYNRHYIGGRSDLFGHTPRAAAVTARTHEITSPGRTVMFTDAAFLRGRTPSYELIEYSFAEPPAQIGPGLGMRPSPSIHFRHAGGKANAAWADGHVSAQLMSFTDPPGGAVRLRFGLGWFGPDGNAWFDLE